MKKQTRLYRRRLNETLDLEARERAQNAYRNCFQKYKTAIRTAKENIWKKYGEDNMNRDPWSIMYRIVANKLKTGNIMSTIKKADGSMTEDWQETANEIKCLFLKDDEALKRDRLSTEEEDVVEVSEIREYIHALKPNKAPGLDGIKAEIYQKTSDITAPFPTQIINDCFRKGYFPTQHKKAELSLIYKGRDKDPQDAKSYRPICLLNIQGKIVIKAIRLHSYLEQQEKPHPKQYGYKKGNPRWTQ